MNKSILAGCIAALTMLGACQKDENTAPDPGKVAINVTSPVPGQVYRSGDTIRMRASISYPGQLHGYELQLTDSATGAVVYDDAQHIHTDSFRIDGYWIAGANRAMSLKFSLVATIDHDGAVARKDFGFSVIPH